jgi:hypothetical protein
MLEKNDDRHNALPIGENISLKLGVADNVNQKVNALLNALNSDEGINVIIQALRDPVREVRNTAYWLLTETKNEAATKALRCYPYAQMQLLHIIEGYSPRQTGYFAISTDRKVLLSNCHSEMTMGYALATINIWNLQTGKSTDTQYVTHEYMGTGQDGRISVSSFQHIVTVVENWDRKSPLRHNTLRGSIEQAIDISSLAVSDDGSIVAGGGYQYGLG